MSRILGAVRLSNLTRETTSPERQAEQIAALTTKVRGDELVKIVYDLDVSGAVSPFDREGLGPWLTDDPPEPWDGLMVTKLDRLTRSLQDLLAIVNWLEKRKKTLISVSESIDLKTAQGRMFVKMLGIFAEFERDRMSERRAEAFDTLKANGYWNGGTFPFGWKPVEDGDHWKLAEDDEYQPVLAEMIRMADDHKSPTSIAAWLNERRIPTMTDIVRAHYGKQPRGTGWKPQAVRAVLTSNGVQLPDTGRESGPKKSRMLLHIAKCAYCQGMLYGKANKTTEYYACTNTTPDRGAREKCMAKLVRADWLEGYLDDWFQEHQGFEIPEKVTVRGTSADPRIKLIEREMVRVASDHELTASERVAKLADLGNQLDALPKAMPTREVLKLTGRYVRDEWPTWTKEQKRQFLLDYGFEVYAGTVPGETGIAVIPGEAYARKSDDPSVADWFDGEAWRQMDFDAKCWYLIEHGYSEAHAARWAS